jgi:hypothetical protein
MYQPVLPIGTELFVLDGPVAASGYTWYKVAPVSFAELDGPGSGWVAIADKNGDPWIAPAQGPTADLAIALADVARATRSGRCQARSRIDQCLRPGGSARHAGR